MIGISDASLAGSQISYAAGALNYYVQTGTIFTETWVVLLVILRMDRLYLQAMY